MIAVLKTILFMSSHYIRSIFSTNVNNNWRSFKHLKKEIQLGENEYPGKNQHATFRTFFANSGKGVKVKD